jgi:hypothetical protein
MDFWERTRQTLNKGLDNSKDLFSKARERAKDLSEKGILKFEIMQLENQAEKLIGKIGTRTYEALVKEGQNTVSQNTSGIKELILEVEDVRKRIEEKRIQLDRL